MEEKLLIAVKGAFVEWLAVYGYQGMKPGKKIARMLFDEQFNKGLEWRIKHVLKHE